MKYSRKEIDKAGKTVITEKDTSKVNEALNKINDWRQLHLAPLDLLQVGILNILKVNNQKIVFVSRRLKRLTSILYKLDLNPKMGLGGMQDIGGLRIVLSDIENLYRTLDILKANVPESFTLKEKINDYVELPKESGYRSIHLVYKYHSEDTYDGMNIELQIRTKLQHSWAMAVETAGLVTKTPLKSSQGEEAWLNFFKIVSSLFAIKEEKPIMYEHQVKGWGMKDLMKLLYNVDNKHNFSYQLKALRISVNYAKTNNITNGYYILDINFITQMVHISAYENEQEEEASSTYSKMEKEVEDSKNAVVLVSVPKMVELQEAYPSYFLDTKDFLNAIDTMKDNCVKWGYV